jgi:hypothetical protein
MPAKMETLGGLSSLDTERLTAADAGDSDWTPVGDSKSSWVRALIEYTYTCARAHMCIHKHTWVGGWTHEFLRSVYAYRLKKTKKNETDAMLVTGQRSGPVMNIVPCKLSLSPCLSLTHSLSLSLRRETRTHTHTFSSFFNSNKQQRTWPRMYFLTPFLKKKNSFKMTQTHFVKNEKQSAWPILLKEKFPLFHVRYAKQSAWPVHF